MKFKYVFLLFAIPVFAIHGHFNKDSQVIEQCKNEPCIFDPNEDIILSISPFHLLFDSPLEVVLKSPKNPDITLNVRQDVDSLILTQDMREAFQNRYILRMEFPLWSLVEGDYQIIVNKEKLFPFSCKLQKVHFLSRRKVMRCVIRKWDLF